MAQDMEIRRNYAANNSIQLNHNGDFSGGGFVGYIGSSAAPYTITDNYAAVSFVDNVGLYGTNPDYLGGFFGSIRKKTTDTIENNFFAGSSQKDCVGYRYENAAGDCTSVSASALYSAQHPVYTREGSAWEFGSTWLSPVNKFPLLKSSPRV